MSTMKAAIYTGIEQIELQEVERKAPAPGYLLIDTKRTGICGSDLHSYFGHWQPSGEFAGGHETCGVVAEVGEGVTGFREGDLVTAECFSHCGECVYCRTGHYNHCRQRRGISHGAHGGFAEYTTVHESGVFKLPDGMAPEEGVMVEPLAVANRAVAQSQAAYPDTVVVIGGGTIGLLCLAVAKAIGVRSAFITAKYPHQDRVARELRADRVLMVGEDDARECMRDATAGLGADAVIDTIGTAQTFDQALSLVRPRGTVVLLAGYHQPHEVHLGRIVSTEAIVTGSNCYGYSGMQKDFDMSIDLIQSGRVDTAKLVTHRFPLTEIVEAFKVAADKNSGSVKVHVCQ